MSGMLGGEYRDETRIVHMLQALERIEHPEVPCADIAGFRHKLVHDYSGIDFGILWDAMTKDVPLLLPMFRKLVAALPPAPDKPANIGDFM